MNVGMSWILLLLFRKDVDGVLIINIDILEIRDQLINLWWNLDLVLFQKAVHEFHLVVLNFLCQAYLSRRLYLRCYIDPKSVHFIK